MKKFEIAYIPIGVPTFDLECAIKEFDKSVSLLKGLEENCVCPDEMLLSIDKLQDFLSTIDPDLIVVQNITFANAAYITEVLMKLECPVLLWTLREPIIDGGRLRLNSLTGAYSAANTLAQFRNGNFEYIYGAPQEDEVIDKIKKTIDAARIKYELRNLKLASIGHTPQGFGFGRALDLELATVFGARLESIEARELIDKAKAYKDEDFADMLEDFDDSCTGYKDLPQNNINDSARLLKAYETYVTENNIKAISSRCWPDFFVSFGTPVCTVLSMLNDLGVVASCEADTAGALSMYVGSRLTKQPVFFGDPVSLDETENTITYWHCGMAPCSLAKGEKANIGVHPNRKIGPVMDFGCKEYERATIFRIGKNGKGEFRFFIAKGKILDKPKQFNGTSIVVKTKNNSKDVVNQSVKDGWEPHFVVAYGDIADELEVLGNMLNLEVLKY